MKMQNDPICSMDLAKSR